MKLRLMELNERLSACKHRIFPVAWVSALRPFVIILAGFLIANLFCPKKALALTGPSVSISVPSSTSGVITIPVTYNFPDDNGKLYVEVSDLQFRPLDSFIAKGSSGIINLTIDTTHWQNGTHTIKAAAYYINSPLSAQDGPYSITINNTPLITVNSPAGSVRGSVEFNLNYKFPSTYATYGLFWFYLDGSGGAFKTMQVPLSSSSSTEGTMQFNYDATYWTDGLHTIKIVARMGVCFSCSDIRPNPNIQNIVITTQNVPNLKVISPSGRVKGIVNASVSYDFPSTNYSSARISFERQDIFGTYSEIASKTIPLNPISSTVGTWNFTFDVANWQDADYVLRAKATYSNKTGYEYIFITVANKAVEIPKTKQLPQDKATTVAEPINVATGNMFTSSTDILIPSKEIPLELSRTYNSQDDFNGSFGYGWRSNFDVTLTEQPDQSVVEVDENGVYTVYAKNPDGTYTPSSGKYSILAKNPDGTFTILRKHGRKLYFNSSGLLTKIEERNSHSLNILRYSSGIITEVSDSSGRKLTFISNSEGKTTQITDPAGRIFKYEYDASGNLIKTADPLNNETLYQYDTNHNLIQQTDANGHLLCFEYDSSGRAYRSWQDDQNNEVVLAFDPANKATITTDSLGNATKYEYNDYGLVTKITDSQGNAQLFGWDGQLNKVSATNQNGLITIFTYDSRGNLLSIKDPLDNITSFTYEPNFDLIASVTDALGNKTEYLYDAKGNLIQVKDALGNTANYSYDAQGQLTQLKDANGNITNFSYDAYGNLFKITDSLNNQTNFTNDIIGNLIQITDAKGSPTNFTYDLLNRLIKITYSNSSQVNYSYDKAGNLISFIDQNGNSTTYAYDAVNRLARVTDALGSITQYAYDTEGNRLSIIDANLNKTQYFYDSLNRLIKTLDPLNHQTLFGYDPIGNLISKIDANGNTINYAYDADNRLTKITYPDSSTVSFTYDALGRCSSMTDSSGTTAYSYDALSHLIQVDGPQASDTISYAYDKMSNRIQMTNPDGGIINYTYDTLNRPVSVTDPQGRIVTYAYDSLSNLIQTVYPNNTQASHTFDNLNRLVSLTNRAGADVISSYAYEYNPLGMRTKVTLSDGSYTAYSYDGLSRLIAESNNSAGGQSIFSAGYQFDPLGNRLSYAKIDYHSFIDDFNRTNSLNIGNNWIEVTGDWQIDNSRIFMPNAETDAVLIYSDQNIPNPAIEATVQLETVGNKKGSYIIFSYQNPNDFYYAGLEGISDLWVMGHYQNGSYNDLSTLSEPIEKLIDYRLRLTVAGNSAILENLENGVYTQKLNYIFTSLPSGKVGLSAEKSRTRFDDFKVLWQNTTTTTYIYNPNNQLIQSIADGSAATAYAYDKNGNLIQKSEAADITDYAYDYENRLSGINLPNGANIAYRYDAIGRRISKDINGQLTNYLYDTEDILSEQSSAEAATYTHGPGIDNPISMSKASGQYYYHSDGLGSVVQLTNLAGSVIQSYQYDAYGNIIQKQGDLANQFTYTGRELDAESGLYYYRNRYYDPKIGRFISQDPIGIIDSLNLYTYCSNNPVNWVDPFGLSKQKNNPWWQKLEEGYYYGTAFGTEAAEWYAQQQLRTGNPFWAVPRSIASLWTPETYQATGWVLAGGYLFVKSIPHWAHWEHARGPHKYPHLQFGNIRIRVSKEVLDFLRKSIR